MSRSDTTPPSPNVGEVRKEAGVWTADAINLLWTSLNRLVQILRRECNEIKETIAPKVLSLAATSSVNDLDLRGASVLSFTGGSAQNVTGFRAPETGETHFLIVQNSGAGTITAKHNTTSEAQNQLFNKTSADVAIPQHGAVTYIYLAAKWRQVS